MSNLAIFAFTLLLFITKKKKKRIEIEYFNVPALFRMILVIVQPWSTNHTEKKQANL